MRAVFKVFPTCEYDLRFLLLVLMNTPLHLEDAVGKVTVVLIVPRTGPLRAEVCVCVRV